jgi:hypothetical protein
MTITTIPATARRPRYDLTIGIIEDETTPTHLAVDVALDRKHVFAAARATFTVAALRRTSAPSTPRAEATTRDERRVTLPAAVSSARLDFDFDEPGTAERCDFTVIVDALDEIAETDESNNLVRYSLRWTEDGWDHDA